MTADPAPSVTEVTVIITVRRLKRCRVPQRLAGLATVDIDINGVVIMLRVTILNHEPGPRPLRVAIADVAALIGIAWSTERRR